MSESRFSKDIDPQFNLARGNSYVDAVDVQGHRILSGPFDSAQVMFHGALRDAGVPLFSLEADNAELAYRIPDGAQPLEKLGVPIRRNVTGYANVFRQSGRLTARLMHMGYEMAPDDGTITTKTALARSMDRATVNVVPVPPYELLETNHSPEELIHMLTDDLTKVLARPEDSTLVEHEVREGFYELG
jgi:hypothetical protein